MKFVTCNLIGPGSTKEYHNFGLGNQLFLVATTLSYSINNNLTALFPDMKNPKFGNYTESIFKKLSLDTYKEDLLKCEYFEDSFSYSPIPVSKENIKIYGYFQSYKYFQNNRSEIMKILMPEKIELENLNNKYSTLLRDSAACHIRLGDYKALKDFHTNLQETNYFKNAISSSRNKNIVIFSDDLELAKTLELDTEKNLIYIQTNSDVEDLYLMSLFNEVIISNSTFSWWAAWLNNLSNCRIVYPNRWFGIKKNYDTKDLIPDHWNICNV